MNINFNDGYEEITINNDPDKVIRINTNDFGILGRIQRAQLELQEDAEKIINETGTKEDLDSMVKMFDELDRVAREKVDSILGEGTCKNVFGNVNIMTMDDNGDFILGNFLDAIIPYITDCISKSAKNHNDKISKYTAKYENKSKVEE